MRAMFLGAVSALLALAGASSGSAAPLTLDILLELETFGRIAIDPTGVVGVVEERRARRDLPRYDLQAEGGLWHARLHRIDLGSPDGARPLLPPAADAGYRMGPFSPDGSRLVVYRLQGLSLRLGLVELATGAVIWTDVAPESGVWGRAVEWLSEESLLVLGTPDGGLPPRLAQMNALQRGMPELWARAAAGEAAYVTSGWEAPPPAPPLRRLWRIDARTGAAEALTEGPFLDFEASPDGRYAALVQDGPILPPPGADTATEIRRGRTLRLVNLETGAAVDPAETVDISTSLLSWAPSSEALLVAVRGERPALLSVASDGSVRDVTPHGVSPDTTVDVHGSPTVQAGWADGAPVLLGRRDGAQAWFLQSRDGPLQLEGVGGSARLVAQGRSSLLFADGGRIFRLGPDRIVREVGVAAAAVRPEGPFGQRGRFDPMKSTDAVVQRDGRLCRVQADDPQTETCVMATSGSAVGWPTGVVLERGEEARGLNTLTFRSARGSRVVMRLNPELDAVDRVAPREVRGPTGARGWLYLPHATGSAAPPVVVIPYPGKTFPSPPAAMIPESVQLVQNGALLVTAGYAVLYPDLTATPEPAAGLSDRILAVVDAAAAEGLVDPTRIGLWGHSFGAWAAMMSTTQTDRFAAVVAHNGSYQLSSVIGESPLADRMAGANDYINASNARWLETGQAGMRRAYWSDPERYRRNSPFEAADRITAPVLLVQGELDLAPSQSGQMYAALRRLNRPARLTLLFGEDHGIQGPGNAGVYYEQVLNWFDRHLRPVGDADVRSNDAARPR
ncbi:MAG: dipeptidyl aminopeptidase/acylaminoacyl peptidase [Brevundimonas sp.]|jgi:dipeptidyl aminopeptidase/acylaminoacyl peptidase|uniref:S9 family peptidase n=1 Tax=Brevundimonas sp. TaxID=1871086 RepID=UPI0039E5A261